MTHSLFIESSQKGLNTNTIEHAQYWAKRALELGARNAVIYHGKHLAVSYSNNNCEYDNSKCQRVGYRILTYKGEILYLCNRHWEVISTRIEKETK